ncbi:6494_t:CDS:2 [Gigaspora margarita]|uniref:6494_t:CDS:1 n=1 Tax=Gigaspora margarita TaxID=4874 RepID=A0ABN7UF46_GIGMA|nr:6494_t:CDS:2 [Gigaspora margarita]
MGIVKKAFCYEYEYDTQKNYNYSEKLLNIMYLYSFASFRNENYNKICENCNEYNTDPECITSSISSGKKIDKSNLAITGSIALGDPTNADSDFLYEAFPLDGVPRGRLQLQNLEGILLNFVNNYDIYVVLRP